MPKAAPLTDLQKAILASGKILAKELGLTQHKLNKFLLQSVEFTEGQTGLVVGPNGIQAGTFEVKVFDYFGSRRSEYIIKDAFYFTKYEKLVEGKWIPAFQPELYFAAGAKLYVSSTPAIV